MVATISRYPRPACSPSRPKSPAVLATRSAYTHSRPTRIKPVWSPMATASWGGAMSLMSRSLAHPPSMEHSLGSTTPQAVTPTTVIPSSPWAAAYAVCVAAREASRACVTDRSADRSGIFAQHLVDATSPSLRRQPDAVESSDRRSRNANHPRKAWTSSCARRSPEGRMVTMVRLQCVFRSIVGMGDVRWNTTRSPRAGSTPVDRRRIAVPARSPLSSSSRDWRRPRPSTVPSRWFIYSIGNSRDCRRFRRRLLLAGGYCRSAAAAPPGVWVRLICWCWFDGTRRLADDRACFPFPKRISSHWGNLSYNSSPAIGCPRSPIHRHAIGWALSETKPWQSSPRSRTRLSRPRFGDDSLPGVILHCRAGRLHHRRRRPDRMEDHAERQVTCTQRFEVLNFGVGFGRSAHSLATSA